MKAYFGYGLFSKFDKKRTLKTLKIDKENNKLTISCQQKQALLQFRCHLNRKELVSRYLDTFFDDFVSLSSE